MSIHSCVISPHLKDDLVPGRLWKYGRLFPQLPALKVDVNALIELGRPGGALDAISTDPDDAASDDATTPAGWPLFGHLIAHDLTADRSLLSHHARLRALHNFRTPAIDLEGIYGLGPSGEPFLYDVTDPDTFLLGRNDAGLPNDLPRNSQGIAIIGDSRNDSQMLTSQMHLAYLKFHNAAVAYVRAQDVSPAQVFTEARQLVRWHHQWLAVHAYLPLTVGEELVRDILDHGPKYYHPTAHPMIPVEFADAADRFGHSQIRARYRLNDDTTAPIFPQCRGGRPIPQAYALDWRYFIDVDADHPPQFAKRIDAKLVHPLTELPESVVGNSDIPAHTSLAVRDLLRGRALDLPSGEAVARAMDETPLAPEQVGLREHGWHDETPLWLYVLKEAEVLQNGERLGPVGGRIVAEVLIGLIAADPTSYLANAPDWMPVFPARQPNTFTLADMLRFAGAV